MMGQEGRGGGGGGGGSGRSQPSRAGNCGQGEPRQLEGGSAESPLPSLSCTSPPPLTC